MGNKQSSGDRGRKKVMVESASQTEPSDDSNDISDEIQSLKPGDDTGNMTEVAETQQHHQTSPGNLQEKEVKSKSAAT